ncbi:MAG: aldehyde dehydrogenase family protein [Planctomycetota bacterium]|nr:MAG: aldehyde dehydrogenase family protein [Planctomycetota bacterium]
MTRSLYVASRPRATDRTLAVQDKYTGAPFEEVAVAGAQEVEDAIAAADAARDAMARTPIHRRAAALRGVASALRDRREAFTRALIAEVGKPVALARGEVDRAIETFTISAEEAGRQGGETLPLDATRLGEGLFGMTVRRPIGPCSFITPFNFPLNLAAHKIGPAIAAGCPCVLKPDDRTPITSLMLGEILAGLDLPEGAFGVLPCPDEGRDLFTTDDRLRLLSFTGSPKVGWELKSRAGRKRVVLELGGNAACIVDETADTDRAIERIAFGAFYQAGQSCISVQRVFAHESVYGRIRDGVVERARAISGRRGRDDESAILGPVIDAAAAERIVSWLDEAVAAGARVLTGGGRDGAWVEPTVVERAPRDVRLSCEEVFGPVVLLAPFDEFGAALAAADDSAWGLQAGVFTARLDRALQALDRLEVGGVIVNDIPSTRADAMPYGGVKGSGLGREGPRWAIRDMTEKRLLVINRRV